MHILDHLMYNSNKTDRNDVGENYTIALLDKDEIDVFYEYVNREQTIEERQELIDNYKFYLSYCKELVKSQ